MADKILTFNGKTISGPSGTGMVMVLEPGCRIGNDIWYPYDLDYKDPTMEDFTEYVENEERLPGNEPFGYAVVEGHTLYTYQAVIYLKENQSTLFPGWHLATMSELENLADYAHAIEDSGGDWYEALDTKGPKGFNFSDAYCFMDYVNWFDWYWQEGSGFGDRTIGGSDGIWNIRTTYGLDDSLYDYDDFIKNEYAVLFTVRLIKDK